MQHMYASSCPGDICPRVADVLEEKLSEWHLCDGKYRGGICVRWQGPDGICPAWRNEAMQQQGQYGLGES